MTDARSPAAEPLVRWHVNLLVWTVFAGISASQASLLRSLNNEPAGLLQIVVPQLAVWYFWALLTPAVFRLNARLWDTSRARALAVHLAVAIPVVMVHMLVVVAVARWTTPAAQIRESFWFWYRGYVGSRAQFDLLTYFGIVGAGLALQNYRRYREREIRTSRLEAQLAQAQLQALKMQLHPHFLFNTLQAISVLIRENPAAATRTVTLLGDLLRLTLENAGTQEVPLREEIKFLELYLEIEQTRFQDRLTVRFDIAPDALDTPVPNFILQPLVENAVRHGVAPRTAPGHIMIRARREDGSVAIEIEDDGPGITHPDAAPAGNGIGLATTRSRLEKLYGERHRFSLQNLPDGGLRVSLAVPVEPAGAPHG